MVWEAVETASKWPDMGREAVEMPRNGLKGPCFLYKSGGWCALSQGLGLLILRRAVSRSDLAPPAAVCGTESSVARRRAYGSRALSPARFGAFALLDVPGLTHFRVLGLRVQGF